MLGLSASQLKFVQQYGYPVRYGYIVRNDFYGFYRLWGANDSTGSFEPPQDSLSPVIREFLTYAGNRKTYFSDSGILLLVAVHNDGISLCGAF